MGGWVAKPVGVQGYGVETTVPTGPCVDFQRDAMHLEQLLPVMSPLPTIHPPRVSETNNGGVDVQPGGSGRSQSTPPN